MIDKAILKEVHKAVNNRLYRNHPMLDMANLKKHPEGHWGLWEIEWILETYEEVKNEVQ